MDKQLSLLWLRRRLALQFRDDESLQSVVDGRDIARVLLDDAFLARFLRPRLGLIQVFDSIVKCLKWRSSTKVFELAGNGVPGKGVDASLFYFNGIDKDSRSLGICRFGALCKMKEMSMEAKRQLLVFRLERLSTVLPAEEQVTILFDVTDGEQTPRGSGSHGAVKDSDISIELAVFFGRLLVHFYPRILGLLLVLQDPDRPVSIYHLLSTVMQPAEVSVSDLLIDIALSELPGRYNGSSAYLPPFSLTTEALPVRAWAEGNVPTVLRTCDSVLLGEELKVDTVQLEPRQPPGAIMGSLASIWPSQSQEFSFEGPITAELNTTIVITNTSPFDISFKVKTTNLSRFRLKPAIGCVAVCESVEISVCRHAITESKTKDRFLVLVTGLPRECTPSPEWLSSFWKTVTPQQVQELRLVVSHNSETAPQPPTEQPLDVLLRVESKLDSLATVAFHEPAAPPPALPRQLAALLLLAGFLLGWFLRDMVLLAGLLDSLDRRGPEL